MQNLPQTPEWKKILRPGQRIFLGAGATCPLALIEAALPHMASCGDIEILQGLTLGPAPWTEDHYTPNLKVNAFYLDPRLSNLVNAGIDDYTPAHYSDIPEFFDDGILKLDLAFVMVSPPDEWGYCSFGPTVGWNPSACRNARLVVAQINPQMPRTGGLSTLHLSKIDYAISVESKLPELSGKTADPAYEKIGEFIAALINDGDTLQMGVGQVSQGLTPALRQHKQLGIHSELIGDGIQDLFERGVIDNSKKTLLPGKCVAAQALGSKELYQFLHHNMHFDFRPSEFINNPLSIARNDRMVSVNSALLVDLTGQVVADSIQGLFRSGVGSMVDFVRGAAMSKKGRPIIALPSTQLNDEGIRISSLAAELPAGTGVGCHRSDVHYIVTEYGVASLRGQTIQERVQELIQISHPEFREDLLRDARKHNLVPSFFRISAPYQENDTKHLQFKKLQLKDDKSYILRPLGPADDRRLQEFFYSHTEETIFRRYGFTVTRMSRERASELVGIDQNKDYALAIVELHGPRQIIQAVGRYYLDADGQSAEMAFVVAEQKRRLGMARILLEEMLESAKKRNLYKLWAQVDRENVGMLTLFRKLGGIENPGEDYNTAVMTFLINSEKAVKKENAFLPFRQKPSAD